VIYNTLEFASDFPPKTVFLGRYQRYRKTDWPKSRSFV